MHLCSRIATEILRLAESARRLCSLLRQSDLRTMPSVLERRRALISVAMPGRMADEVVTRELVVARHFDRIEASHAHPLQRITGELIRRKFLVSHRDILTVRIEVAVREVSDLMRENRVQHRLDGVWVIDSHPLLEKAVEELLIIEDASAVAGMRRAGTQRLVDMKIGAPHVVELRHDRLVRLTCDACGFTARVDGAVARRDGVRRATGAGLGRR